MFFFIFDFIFACEIHHLPIVHDFGVDDRFLLRLVVPRIVLRAVRLPGMTAARVLARAVLFARGLVKFG
jgi:hypothetical protein